MTSRGNNEPPLSKRKIETINPATEEVLKEYEIVKEEQVIESVKRARNAFVDWKKDIDKGADHLYSVATETEEKQRNSCKNSDTRDGEINKRI